MLFVVLIFTKTHKGINFNLFYFNIILAFRLYQRVYVCLECNTVLNFVSNILWSFRKKVEYKIYISSKLTLFTVIQFP